MQFRVLSVVFLLAAAIPAAAQVTVNPKALEPPESGGSSTGQKPAASSESEKSARHGRASNHDRLATGRHQAPSAKTEQPGGKPATAAAPAVHSLVRTPPVVPQAPPPVAVLAPLQPPPPAHVAPPTTPISVVAGAIGEALPIPDGLRLTFGSGSTDLNPATDAALQKLAHQAAGSPEAVVTVKAYAAGSADDPSTPRRLSLSRALAARTVLISQGISSARIYVRALGSNAEKGPPDRVDITVGTPTAEGKHGP